MSDEDKPKLTKFECNRDKNLHKVYNIIINSGDRQSSTVIKNEAKTALYEKLDIDKTIIDKIVDPFINQVLLYFVKYKKDKLTNTFVLQSTRYLPYNPNINPKKIFDDIKKADTLYI